MGIDASLFSDDGQRFYYDREYNLQPLDEEESLGWNWNRLSSNHRYKGGLSKEELEDYLKELICVFERAEEEEFNNKENQIAWAEKALKWTESLPEGCKIISRNETQDEYFELCKEYEEHERKGK